MLKLVLDTNTLVSAFFWKGNESKLFQAIGNNKAKLFANKAILEEIESVLKRPKFFHIISLTKQSPEDILQKIMAVSHLTIGKSLGLTPCRDPKGDLLSGLKA